MEEHYFYPSEKELKKIENWKITKRTDCIKLIEYIRIIWWCEGWGFKFTGKKVLCLQLHTGGWSGNESIINALHKNFFWSFFWEKSLRGGHYYFKINKEFI